MSTAIRRFWNAKRSFAVANHEPSTGLFVRDWEGGGRLSSEGAHSRAAPKPHLR